MTFPPQEPFVAWHVGRSGEVAGGMTQVVNAYRRWPFIRAEVRVVVSRDGTRGPRAMRLLAQALLKVWAMRRNRHSEVVVVHLSQGGSFIREGALLWLAKKLNIGTVAHLHGSRFVEFARRRPRLVAWILSCARSVIVLSDETMAEVKSLVPEACVVLVPNAVPAGGERPKEKLVVFGGAVGRRKGVDILVKAWRLAGLDGWRLAIAGPLLESDLVAEDMPAGVEVLGSVAHRQLMDLLERAAVAVLPSRDEAMPMFILEALARRACVVATTVGGIPRVLGEGRGLLVAPGSVEELARALSTVLGNGEERTAIAEKGHRSFMEKYSAEAVYPVLEATWARALRDAGQC